MLLPGSRHGEGKNETISRIPSFRFSFRAAGKKILHLRYVSLYLSRLNSSPFFPISRVDGVAFERERERERGRCTDSVSVGNSKISNYPGAQSSVKSSYDVLNFGNASFTRHLSRAKFEIHNPPQCLFDRISRGVKGSIVLSISLRTKKPSPYERWRKITEGQRQCYSWGSVRAKQAKETGDGCGP